MAIETRAQARLRREREALNRRRPVRARNAVGEDNDVILSTGKVVDDGAKTVGGDVEETSQDVAGMIGAVGDTAKAAGGDGEETPQDVAGVIGAVGDAAKAAGGDGEETPQVVAGMIGAVGDAAKAAGGDGEETPQVLAGMIGAVGDAAKAAGGDAEGTPQDVAGMIRAVGDAAKIAGGDAAETPQRAAGIVGAVGDVAKTAVGDAAKTAGGDGKETPQDVARTAGAVDDVAETGGNNDEEAGHDNNVIVGAMDDVAGDNEVGANNDVPFGQEVINAAYGAYQAPPRNISMHIRETVAYAAAATILHHEVERLLSSPPQLHCHVEPLRLQLRSYVRALQQRSTIAITSLDQYQFLSTQMGPHAEFACLHSSPDLDAVLLLAISQNREAFSYI